MGCVYNNCTDKGIANREEGNDTHNNVEIVAKMHTTVHLFSLPRGLEAMNQEGGGLIFHAFSII